MERVFLKILEMNMAGTACILFVLALRVFLRKRPRSFSYALWAVVFLRLLCPFALQSRYFGLALGNMEQTLETAAYERELVQYQLLVHKDGSVETLASRNVLRTSAPSADQPGMERGTDSYQHPENAINRRYSRSAVQLLERGWVTVGSLIWAVLAAVLLGYSFLSYLLLRRRLGQAVKVQEDVYESDRIDTPFLLGVLDPRIYLPVGLPREQTAYVLAHELVHLKRGDYLVKLVTWLALSLHWFNPLVWLAYGLMVCDMEMSCDERVIHRLGEGSKKAYSQALLAIASASGGSFERHLLISAPLSFGENDIRSRVKNILAYRSVKPGSRVALGLLLAVAGLVLLTDWQISGAEMDQSDGEADYPYTELEGFQSDIRPLSDWVSGWELPHEELVMVGEYQADLLTGGGVLFGWKEEERDLQDTWAPVEWKSAGGFTQIAWNEREEEGTPPTFTFDDQGNLTDMWLSMNHTGINAPTETLEGCREQAVLVSMNHDLYTIPELDELAQAGRPVPEEETTADFWYIGFARKDAPYGYVLFLAERYYTREEAIAMARSIRFTEEAWAADAAAP